MEISELTKIKTPTVTSTHLINNIVKNKGRIIFNVLNSHLYRIQELFNEVAKTDRKIVVMGKRLQNIVKYSLENGYRYIMLLNNDTIVPPKCISTMVNSLYN